MAGIGTAIANNNGLFAGHPSWAYWFYGMSALLLACSIVGWIVNAKHSTGIAEIKFTGYELHRTPEPNQLTSIFLRTKIELSGVAQATVTSYRMELSHLGVLTLPKFRDDVDRFEITDWSRDPIPHDDLRPLPTQLRSGNPVEGWVHFVTDWNQNQLYGSYVRLFADTAYGSGHLELRPGREYWNVVPNRIIAEKRFGTIAENELL